MIKKYYLTDENGTIYAEITSYGKNQELECEISEKFPSKEKSKKEKPPEYFEKLQKKSLSGSEKETAYINMLDHCGIEYSTFCHNNSKFRAHKTLFDEFDRDPKNAEEVLILMKDIWGREYGNYTANIIKGISLFHKTYPKAKRKRIIDTFQKVDNTKLKNAMKTVGETGPAEVFVRLYNGKSKKDRLDIFALNK